MPKTWKDIAKAEFGITAKDAARLKRISAELLAWEFLAMNTRSLTDDEKVKEQALMTEVEAICDRYSIAPSDGDSVGYEYPDPRSGSGLRFILPSGHRNSLGGYDL